jgi:hypothetical protein
MYTLFHSGEVVVYPTIGSWRVTNRSRSLRFSSYTPTFAIGSAPVA